MPEPASQRDPRHEALCRRCGTCCYEKYIVEERVFTSMVPCEHLDVKTRLCRVYEKRFEANPRCLDVESGIRYGVFPAGCPYARGRAGYVPSEPGRLDAQTVRKIRSGRLRTAEEIRKEMRRKRNAPR